MAHEPVTESYVSVVLMRLNETKRRANTMGHLATQADIEAAEMLIRGLADMAFAEDAAPDNKDDLPELAWHPLDTEVRD